MRGFSFPERRSGFHQAELRLESAAFACKPWFSSARIPSRILKPESRFSHGVEASPRAGVASLGVRPTIDGGGEPLLEAHLFDFDGDLYGRRIEIEFVRKLRDEAKFDDLDAMVRQIDRDAAEARSVLGVGRGAANGSPDGASAP